jgi:hypothetical protein
VFTDLYNKQSDRFLTESNIMRNCLKEQDFYPPEDNRNLKSYVNDIYGGDNFADYCEYIFDVLEEEEYYN